MFRSICRINHSCKPNAYWYFNQTEGQLALHASRAVNDGDELVVDYCGHDECDEWCANSRLASTLPKPCIPPAHPDHRACRDGERRRQHLAVFFGFQCACPHCAPPPPPQPTPPAREPSSSPPPPSTQSA
jgi:SET domain-containing protein